MNHSIGCFNLHATQLTSLSRAANIIETNKFVSPAELNRLGAKRKDTARYLEWERVVPVLCFWLVMSEEALPPAYTINIYLLAVVISTITPYDVSCSFKSAPTCKPPRCAPASGPSFRGVQCSEAL